MIELLNCLRQPAANRVTLRRTNGVAGNGAEIQRFTELFSAVALGQRAQCQPRAAMRPTPTTIPPDHGS